MLSDDELTSLRATLSRGLEVAGLGGILNEVAEVIRLGKTEEREVSTYKQDAYLGGDLRPVRRAGKAALPFRVPLRPEEELAVLLSAIEQSVIVPVLLRREISKFLATELESQDQQQAPLLATPQFAFRNAEQELAEDPVPSYKIPLTFDREREGLAEALAGLLTEIRKVLA